MTLELELPLPISSIGGKYLLFDIDAVTWLRKNHQICGVMGGTLPQSPSQNVFLGLPMQIMPEEAQLLVEKGVAYVVDDARAHDQALHSGDGARHAEYLARIRRKAEAASKFRAGQKDEQRQQALGKQKTKPNKATKSIVDDDTISTATPSNANDATDPSTNEDSSLFDTPIPPSTSTPTPTQTPQSYSQLNSLTPTMSHLFTAPVTAPPHPNVTLSPSLSLPNIPPSYPLYRHLHSRSYFLTPGLRFGCTYCVYPGDPLRYHSHFLAVSYGWDDEVDLMDLVGGGRLGTGVKKGFLVGGVESGNTEGMAEGEFNEEERVRTFSIEWAAM